MVELFNTHKIARYHLSEVKTALEELGITPIVKLILANPNEDSISYSTIMEDVFKKVNIKPDLVTANTAKELADKIESAERDDDITGCFVFYPVGFDKIDDKAFMRMIPQYKDIEGLSAQNVYRLVHYDRTFDNTDCKAVVPCTPKAVIKSLMYYDIDEEGEFEGKNVVIVNYSLLLGQPLFLMFKNLKATVTACDKFADPQYIKQLVSGADIVVTAVPRKIELFDDTHIKEGAAVIDCSFEGNFDPDKISKTAGYLSCPGKRKSYRKSYIGRVTTAMAAVNTLYLLRHQMHREGR